MNTAKQFSDAREAFVKIYNYKHWPAAAQFYLSTIHDEVFKIIFGYIDSYNTLLVRIGGDREDGHYEFTGEAAVRYQKELAELDAQEAGLEIDPARFSISVSVLDAQEKKLPFEERLGFSANDVIALRGIVEITE